MRRVIYAFIMMTLATVLWLAGGSEDVQAQTIELKMAHFMSPMHIQHQQSFLPFAKKVEELTGGKVKIKVFPSETLGSAAQLADSTVTCTGLPSAILSGAGCITSSTPPTRTGSPS